MARKPLVGLNADYRPSRKEGPALSFIAAGYYNAIQAAGTWTYMMRTLSPCW